MENLIDLVHKMPKIDLHRHLEGSMRLETLVDIARQNDRELAQLTIEELRPHVQMTHGQPFSASQFLGKFATIRQFYNSPETIRRIAKEVVLDAVEDNVRYMELRFTPHALSNVLECTYDEVISWVVETVHETAQVVGITVNLIISMNRHEGVEIGRKVLETALRYRSFGVVGIDLAGNEEQYSCQPFEPIFRLAKENGFFTTVHAGEWAGANSVRDALLSLRADRLGHGIRMIEDPALIEWVCQKRIDLEVCPTSNLHSGVVKELTDHPLLELYRAGVMTTINTDDTLISNITMSTELLDVMLSLPFSFADIKQHILHAAQSAFLHDAERHALVTHFEQALSAFQYERV